jgi:hypothetical protein
VHRWRVIIYSKDFTVSTDRTVRVSAGREMLVPRDRADAHRVLDQLTELALSAGELAVLLAALVFGRGAPSWWASAKTLAREAGWKDRTSVAKYLASLRRRGIVQVDGPGPGRSVVYTMMFPAEWYARLPGEAPVASFAGDLADARAESRFRSAPTSAPVDEPWMDAARNVPIVRCAVLEVFGATATPRNVDQLRRRLQKLYALSCHRHASEARRGPEWHDALSEVAAEAIRYALDAPTVDQRWSRAFAQLDRVADSDEVYYRLKAAYAPPLSPPAGLAFGGFRTVPRDDSYGDAPLPARLVAA